MYGNKDEKLVLVVSAWRKKSTRWGWSHCFFACYLMPPSEYRPSNLLGSLPVGLLMATVLSIHLLQVLSIQCLVCVLIRRPADNREDKFAVATGNASRATWCVHCAICLRELAFRSGAQGNFSIKSFSIMPENFRREGHLHSCQDTRQTGRQTLYQIDKLLSFSTSSSSSIY